MSLNIPLSNEEGTVIDETINEVVRTVFNEKTTVVDYHIKAPILEDFYPLFDIVEKIKRYELVLVLSSDCGPTFNPGSAAYENEINEIWETLKAKYGDPANHLASLLEGACFDIDEDLNSSSFTGTYFYGQESLSFDVLYVGYGYSIELTFSDFINN